MPYPFHSLYPSESMHSLSPAGISLESGMIIHPIQSTTTNNNHTLWPVNWMYVVLKLCARSLTSWRSVSGGIMLDCFLPPFSPRGAERGREQVCWRKGIRWHSLSLSNAPLASFSRGKEPGFTQHSSSSINPLKTAD